MNRKKFLGAVSLFILSVSFAAADYERPAKIVMLWDYISEKEDNLLPEKKIVPNGLDVVSPTWFSIGSEDADVSSLADREYVLWAHDNGLEVWALFENRSDNWLTFWALFNESKRKKIVEQIAGFVLEYNLDGINVDFELMEPPTGKLFEKLIVELYERLKPLGITLSVDIPIPIRDIREVYDIALVADNSDYIVIMAYDQHHGESKLIGPVAAIDWVKKGIEDTLEYVHCKKVILGIPFFTRVWLENREGGKFVLTSEFKGMKEAYKMFEGTARFWGRDRATEQIYAEYDDDLKCYKVWLEDDHSISLKLDTVNDCYLAGMSAWRRGLEWDEIWDMINAYFD